MLLRKRFQACKLVWEEPEEWFWQQSQNKLMNSFILEKKKRLLLTLTVGFKTVRFR